MLALSGVLVSVLALREFASIVAPVLLALILVIGVHPLTGILHRRGVPRWLAVTTTLITLVAAILGLGSAMALSVAELAALLPTYQDSFTALVDDLRAWLASLGVGHDQILAAVGAVDFAHVAALVGDLLLGVAGVFSNLLFLIFVIVFMGVDAGGFSSRLARVRPQRPEIVGVLDDFVRGTRSYLLLTTVFGLIVATFDAAFLWSIGVPLPALWGLLAFLTGYIPNVGYFIGLIPPALLALLEGGPGLMLAVIVAYAVINFVIQSVIQPKVMSDTVNLSLSLTFLSLVFWSFVIGPIGAVLAIPLTLLTKALLLDVDPNTRWMSSLVEGSRPAPSEDEDGEADEDGADTSDREHPASTESTESTCRVEPATGGQAAVPARTDAGPD
ncbi:AI-2E family transporter [Pseudonocardia adelaidensis]|uniref:AI-2E family transporter n=1 Tax=Pseudonocardia adelaidensis TaxID=648754 RepID=A0ABP9NT84_9PSEU